MENKLKNLESTPSFVVNPHYIETNENRDKIYQETNIVLELEVNVIGTSSGKKYSKYFLDLEKSRAVQNKIQNILL